MENTKRKRKQSHCFVPGCSSGYKSCKKKVSMFSVPKNEDILRKWSKAIPRADKPLDMSCCVCELHFEPHFIEKDYMVIIQGKQVLTPRGLPMLSKDAIPSIFPNLPKYLSKSIPKKRSSRSKKEHSPAKKLKLREHDCQDLDNILPVSNSFEKLFDITLPSEYWVKIKYPQSIDTVSFATWMSYSEDGIPDKKVVVIKVSVSEFFCIVYIRGIIIREQKLNYRDELQVILNDADGSHICSGVGTTEEFPEAGLSKKLSTHNKIILSVKCTGKVEKEGTKCFNCNYQRKLLVNYRCSSKQSNTFTKKPITKNRLKTSQKSANRLKRKAVNLANKIKVISYKNQKSKENCLNKHLTTLNYKQRLAVIECIKASKRKNIKGMAYSKEWMLESIMMRLKSPRLYEHMRINNILVLPSRTCIKKSLKDYEAGYGFNKKTFAILKKKTELMDTFMRHGGILFDELKLSENLQLQVNGKIQGYVDYGDFTPADKKHELCNHGLIFMFQPVAGDWVQVLGVFGTRGNMKGSMLAKLLIEAVVLAEGAGLFVDFLTGDGASWNRAMWKQFGIGVSDSGEIKCKVPHPLDETRYLHFLSDFPHLLKCIRNSLLKTGFHTPDGEVRIEHIRAALKEDERGIKLRAMPKITRTHLAPNNFEKMRVNLAFQLFSLEVLKGLHLYEDQINAQYGNSEPTVLFIKKINLLIEIMTSRIYGKGLKYPSLEFDFLKNFLQYLDDWENYSNAALGFISKSTAVGLRVTISSTLSLVEYFIKIQKYSFVLTSRFSQDKLENFFGIIRQSKGCNDHPTPSEFLTIVECLSFYNLARPPRGCNAQPSIINSLISTTAEKPEASILTTALDTLVDSGNLAEVVNLLSTSGQNPLEEHKQMVEQKSDSRLIYYIAGYVVRKFLKQTFCTACKSVIKENSKDVELSAASYTKNFDKGGLMYPSASLFILISELENQFTKCFSFNQLHRDSICDVIVALSKSVLKKVGCEEHKIYLTQKIVKFFVMTRLHFFLKTVNRNRTSKRDRQKYLKMRRCN